MEKEFEIKFKDKIEVTVEQQKEDRLEYIETLIPHGGHTVWRVNEETLEVEEATYLQSDWIFNGVNKLKMLIEDGWFYTSALNKKNALKNFKNKNKGGIKPSDLKLGR